MLIGLLALCVVVMRCFPETPFARALHLALVERPLDWLSKLERQHLVFVFVTATLFLVAGEFVAVFGAGELLALSLNLSVYLDAVIVASAVTVAAAAATTWRAARARLPTWLGGTIRRKAHAARETRPPGRRNPTPTNSEDEPVWSPALAA